MPDPLNEDFVARQRRKKVVLVLTALGIVLLLLGAIWWGNLADEDIEEGPVSVGEAITDSADD